MQFPVYIMGIHPHAFFEVIGWIAAGFMMMFVRRIIGNTLSCEKRVQLAGIVLLPTQERVSRLPVLND